jgi:predicted AAA+ superfamily ATPase
MEERIKRHIAGTVAEDFKDIEAVFINGARQTGKSTFVEDFGSAYKKVWYYSFDDINLRAAEMSAPGCTFGDFEEGLVILDEIQLVPGSFLALKAKIDDLRRKKQRLKFLLTGSADIMLFPQLAEALVGRMYVRTLYPFSMAELSKTPGAFVEKNFKALPLSGRKFSKAPVSALIPKATFPRLSLAVKNRPQWCQSYISTLLERDVKNLSHIDRIEILPQLLSLLAGRVGGLVNDADLALAAKVSQPTLKRYRTLLNGVFLTWLLPPWFKKLEKRFVKSPKIYFHDTMLLCHILGFSPGEIAAKRPELYGFVLENFAAAELNKELSLMNGAKLYHLRTSDQKEVDFIIERSNGDILAVEVKGSSSVFPEDFKHIRFLATALKDHFIRGMVLYQGEKVIQFDRNLFALPFSALWEL